MTHDLKATSGAFQIDGTFRGGPPSTETSSHITAQNIAATIRA